MLAKPAEQTPLIAADAVRLFHAPACPPTSLQLLPGHGDTVGAALVADARVQGVMFTGSTEVARCSRRNRRLAERGGDTVPLIAETGGQNAMIVDSSALTEQVVGDVLASAFDSAGQRCSALRVLCLQEDVRRPHHRDAARARWTSSPSATRRASPTDVGPVIDAEAQRLLEAHIDAHARAAAQRAPAGARATARARGTFVAADHARDRRASPS